jgi:putative transposase
VDLSSSQRERRSDGLAPVNVKRVYRLMKKHALLLERHTGRRRPREHDGQVATEPAAELPPVAFDI